MDITSPATGEIFGSSSRRAAALMIALGPELAAQVMQPLTDDDIAQLTLEIIGIGSLNAGEREEIMSASYQTLVGRDFVSVGGAEYAQEMLERAVGEERAAEIVQGLSGRAGRHPFEFMQRLTPKDLANALLGERPQVMALVLGYLPADIASSVLRQMPDELQAASIARLATMNRVSPSGLEEVEAVMRKRLGSVFAPRQESAPVGGIEVLVDLLREVDLMTERAILEGVEKTDPETASEVRRRMFVFENITMLDDRSIQRVLREIDNKDLGLSLKGATDDVKQRILANQSERAAKMIEDDMIALGPVRLRQVEEAQGRIVATIRRLEEAEEIFVMREGEGALLE